MISKILVQESDKDIGETIKIILESARHQVVLRQEKWEILEIANDLSPDLIIIDHVLDDAPVVNFCLQARANLSTSKTPILITSTSPAAKCLLGKTSDTDFLEKPFDIESLQDKVRSFTDLSFKEIKQSS